MIESKGWEWEKANQLPWLKPTEDSYYLSRKWTEKNYQNVLDLGSGLGRHSILFAEEGFNVSAYDISEYGIEHLNKWASNKQLDIDTKTGDMHKLPYEDDSFDCIFIYHAISHTDTEGAKQIMKEIKRVLRTGGELYTSMCSKESGEFKNLDASKIDENTIVRTREGPEKDVPHYYVDLDDIIDIFEHFEIEKVRHIDYCYANQSKHDCKYYYINAIMK